MSKGPGRLQRRLITMLEANGEGCVQFMAARHMTWKILDEDHGENISEIVRHLLTTDRAVRRALRSLERRGLVVCMGRVFKAERKIVAYATPKAAEELAEMAAEVPKIQAALARLADQHSPEKVPPPP